jgi:mannobiose 2-epimerase
VVQPLDAAWRPAPGRAGVLTTSYGHNAELAWLLLDAADALGVGAPAVQATALGLIEHALVWGTDRRRGGVAALGPPAGPVAGAVYLGPRRLRKRWWDQMEMLVALLEAYRRTGAPRYLDALVCQWRWCWTRQRDHVGGDWYRTTSRRGRPLDLVKGDDVKCPYHTARALMRLVTGLGALGVRPG